MWFITGTKVPYFHLAKDPTFGFIIPFFSEYLVSGSGSGGYGDSQDSIYGDTNDRDQSGSTENSVVEITTKTPQTPTPFGK